VSRILAARTRLTAELASTTATCNVAVTRDEEGPSIVIRIDDDEAGKYRAVVEKNGHQIVIKIKGGHPAVRRYRGSPPDFKGQDLPVFKALVAEIVADQATRIHGAEVSGVQQGAA
jgi:hypothetical protein